MNFYLDKLKEMVISNKYTNWYFNIIRNALTRSTPTSYYEKHHILPKCFRLGGEKDPFNIVALTGKEHFICHLLLVKMISDKSLKMKLSCAALRMCYTNGVDRHKVCGIMYELIRKNLSESKIGTKGKLWTEEQRKKLENRVPHNKGKSMTEEHKQHLREVRKQQKISPRSKETKNKISLALKGRPRSEETKLKMQLNRKTSVLGTKWWNNGIINKRSISVPEGPNWVRGKIKSKLHSL